MDAPSLHSLVKNKWRSYTATASPLIFTLLSTGWFSYNHYESQTKAGFLSKNIEGDSGLTETGF